LSREDPVFRTWGWKRGHEGWSGKDKRGIAWAGQKKKNSSLTQGTNRRKKRKRIRREAQKKLNYGRFRLVCNGKRIAKEIKGGGQKQVGGDININGLSVIYKGRKKLGRDRKNHDPEEGRLWLRNKSSKVKPGKGQRQDLKRTSNLKNREGVRAKPRRSRSVPRGWLKKPEKPRSAGGPRSRGVSRSAFFDLGVGGHT